MDPGEITSLVSTFHLVPVTPVTKNTVLCYKYAGRLEASRFWLSKWKSLHGHHPPHQ